MLLKTLSKQPKRKWGMVRMSNKLKVEGEIDVGGGRSVRNASDGTKVEKAKSILVGWSQPMGIRELDANGLMSWL